MSPIHTSSFRQQAWEFHRFLIIGLVNAMVGYGAYALFIFMGMNLYVAQAAGHVTGTAFNYFSHSRYVFNMRPKVLPYLASSIVNYVLGALLLTLAVRVIVSPYWAGLIATGCAAVCSYISLKLIAFRAKRTRS